VLNSNEIEHSTGSLDNEDARLFHQSWIPKDMRNVMVVSHGLGEHGGRYGNLVDYFAPRGFGLYVQDHRGHGQSSGARGHVSEFRHYVDDLAAYVRKVGEQAGQGKVVMVGHSLGGLIAIAYSLSYPETVSKLVLSAPGIRPYQQPPRIKASLGKILARLVPRLLMNNELDASFICRDPDVVRAYTVDPLVHDRVSTRFFTEYLGTAARVLRDAHLLNVPVLLLLAGEDRLVDNEANRQFFDKVGSDMKEMKVYPGLYHEIFNEPEKDQVFSKMKSWLAGKGEPD